MSVLDVSVNGRASAEDVYDPLQVTPTDHLYKLGRHPIEKDTAILPTNAMEEFVNTLLGWLAGRLTGAIVWGNQRVGKTQAIRYVMANGQDLLGAPIPISLLSAWDPTHSSLSEDRFFRELLRAIGSHVHGSATASNLRRSAIDIMTDQVRSTKEYRYLLFIDEAQWLAPVQLRYLMDLHNQLKIADIRLITILVGQPELIDNKLSLRNARQNHLLGRFMTATHQYTGLCAVGCGNYKLTRYAAFFNLVLTRDSVIPLLTTTISNLFPIARSLQQIAPMARILFLQHSLYFMRVTT